MKTRLAALATAALTIAGLLGAVPAVAAPKAPASEHARIVAYWTPERMRAALPRELVLAPQTAAKPAVKPAPSPTPTPAPTSSPSFACGTSSGADWSCGGLVQHAVGKVFFSIGTANYVCSGSVVADSDPGRSVVLTAGHCAYDQGTKAFMSNWLFVPDYDSAPTSSCSTLTYGCWTASRLAVDSEWAGESGLTTTAMRNDWGFAVVGAGGKDGATQLDAAVGAFALDTSGTSLVGKTAMPAGYPASKKYDGTRLIYCSQTVAYDPNTSVTYRVAPCGLNGGSSGGPWVSAYDPATDTGTVASLNSYIYSTLSAIHGPAFTSRTAATYTGALGASGNTIVQ